MGLLHEGVSHVDRRMVAMLQKPTCIDWLMIAFAMLTHVKRVNVKQVAERFLAPIADELCRMFIQHACQIASRHVVLEKLKLLWEDLWSDDDGGSMLTKTLTHSGKGIASKMRLACKVRSSWLKLLDFRVQIIYKGGVV